jgi:hypothetical protein
MARVRTSLAEALSWAHAALHKDLQQLDQALARESAAKIRARLDATLGHLVEHFYFEEQNGYLDAVRQREPRFEHALTKLAAEHGELKRTLEELIAKARPAAALDDALREAIHVWIEQVRRHEAKENDLVQDAFNLDIGPED